MSYATTTPSSIVAINESFTCFGYDKRDCPTCAQLCSRGVELCRHMGYDSRGITKGTVAARSMSKEARCRKRRGYKGCKPLKFGGITASLQQIGALGRIKPRARRSLRRGLLRTGVRRIRAEHFIDITTVSVDPVPYYFKNKNPGYRPELVADYNNGGVNWMAAERMLADYFCTNCTKYPIDRIVVQNFERIENLHVYNAYKRYEAEVVRRNRVTYTRCTNPLLDAPNHEWLKRLAERNGLSRQANTVYLLHGTSRENVSSILKYGLKTSYALAKDGMYGKGIYFADESCKANQYTGGGDHKCILICRVVLGHSELFRDAENASNRLFPAANYDSTIAGKSYTVRNGSKQAHNEYIVYQDCACYPEFVVSYSFESSYLLP